MGYTIKTRKVMRNRKQESNIGEMTESPNNGEESSEVDTWAKGVGSDQSRFGQMEKACVTFFRDVRCIKYLMDLIILR